MSERRGPKALELWCRRITEGYPGVNVQNMTTSWRDGLAFCAMIHHFRPDLIDFNSLNKDDVYRNNEKAFRIAEEHLGIPALLDAEDMASCSVPDRLSILTYLSQFYQQFGGSSPSRVAMSRAIETKNQPITPESTPSKVVSRLGMRREACIVCSMPVFLAEKLVISRTTYHRTCFRCARCQAQLTPGNYYETEEGQYCCETCPDEDVVACQASLEHNGGPCEGSEVEVGHERSLSDEEKCVKQGQVNVFSKQTTEISHMRLNFISSHLLQATDSLENNDSTTAVNSMTPIKSDSANECVNMVKNDCEINNSIHKCCLTATNNLDLIETMQTSSQDTKDKLGIVQKNFNDKKTSESDEHLSLVQRRLKLFENPSINQVKLIQDTCEPCEPVCMEPDSLETSVANEVNPIVDAVNVTMMQDMIAKVGDSCDAIDVLNVSTIDMSPIYPTECNPFDDDINEAKVTPEKQSTNPFGSDSEEESQEMQAAPVPAVRRKITAGLDESPKRVLAAPKISLNPFWSDDEEPDSDEDVKVTAPVPKPRTRSSEMSPLKPLLKRDDFHASNSSLASSSSNTTCSSHRKRPAPPPPVLAQISPIKTTPKPRKSRRAPPPPLGSSTPEHLPLHKLTLEESPRIVSAQTASEQSWEDVKLNKNATNISRQSMTESESSFVYQDKSVEGKWKRKKAPAPARPIPQRRRIKVMSMHDVTAELGEIELQQQGLEKQGVRLEHLIREKCERGDNDESTNLTNDADELVLDLFALVNEKNELFRRQAELMLLKRQQRLEEEHADVEYQIRCLMCQPEATKTDFDKQREESLIQRLVDIVERRSEIVECLEMDRRREIEEDRSINMHMEMYTAKKGDRSGSDASIHVHKCKKKLKEKAKYLKKSHKKDADKDVDESEVKLKRLNKKKWF